MLLALLAAIDPMAGALTPERLLLVYGPIGPVTGVCVWLGRRLIQAEGARADRAEARVAELSADLKALNRDVIDRVIPALVENNRTGTELLEVLRTRR